MISKNNTNKNFINITRQLISLMLVSGIMLSLSNVRAEQQQFSQPGVLVSISPENINVNLGGGATSISISGNVTTIAIAAPTPVALPVNAPQKKEGPAAESRWSSWISFSELVKAGAVFGGIGTIATVGIYTLYQNRSHPVVAKIFTVLMGPVDAVKQFWQNKLSK